MRWAPDGARLAMGDSIGGVEVLKADGRRLWRQIERGSAVNDINWSPGGGRLATISSYDVVSWDAVTGKVLLRIEEAGLNETVSWSPDGSRFAWGGAEDKVYIADASTGERLLSCTGHATIVVCASWSPDGRRLASSSADNTARIWDAASGECLLSLEGHEDRVNRVRWAPDGKTIATASWDNTVRVWNVRTGEHLGKYTSHEDSVHDAAWSPDGRLLASCSYDKTVRIFATKSGRELLCLKGHNDWVWSAAFSPDGTRLASASWDGTVRVWDVADLSRKRLKRGVDDGLDAYVRRHLATVGRRPVRVPRPLWVPHLPGAKGEYLGMLKGDEKVDSPVVDIFSDCSSIAAGHSDGKVRRWDLKSGAIVWEGNEKQKDDIFDVAISPDQKHIASASKDNTIRILDAAAGYLKATCEGHDSWVRRVRWSPDGQRLASVSEDRTVRVWDPHSGNCLHSIKGHLDIVWGVDWSPDGFYLASASADKTVRIWDATSGVEIRRFEGHKKRVNSVGWSPDGRRLASCAADRTVRVRNALNGRKLRLFRGHKSEVIDVVWSPDGRFLASMGWWKDQTIRVWDASNAQELMRFTFEDKYSWRIVWSADGAFLASSHHHDVVRFWDARHLVSRKTTRTATKPSRKTIPKSLAPLPAALARQHRLGLYPPMSLVDDLLALIAGGMRDTMVVKGLRKEPGVRALVELRWFIHARMGLVALLLHGLPMKGWEPPDGTTPVEVRDELKAALEYSEAMEAKPTETWLAGLRKNARRIDDRLLTLLNILGPDAVAADPGLPLRLMNRVGELPPLTSAKRSLLGIRLNTGASGHATGSGPGVDRSGIEKYGDLKSLLPSQLMLPSDILAFRYIRSELLYRARQGEEPPRLRPAVILLDVSPPVFGPVEAITRLAAHIVARSLRKAGIPAVLVTTGDKEGVETVRSIEHASDMVEIWTRRTMVPVNTSRCLKLARVIREQLRGGPLEPVVLVLSHAWFGADEDIPAVPNMRGLFVQYPNHDERPAMAGACERWESVGAGETSNMLEMLGRLAGSSVDYAD